MLVEALIVLQDAFNSAVTSRLGAMVFALTYLTSVFCYGGRGFSRSCRFCVRKILVRYRIGFLVSNLMSDCLSRCSRQMLTMLSSNLSSRSVRRPINASMLTQMPGHAMPFIKNAQALVAYGK